MSANPPINHQWPDAELQQDPSHNYALTGKIMLSSIIILFVVVVVLVILHLYARWYLLRFQLRRRNRHRRNSRSRSTRIVFYVDNNRSPAATDSGLDSSVLKSIPVFVYSPESDGSMPECAVCLSEFEEGEKGRVLPKCKHCFHTECIDMWFGNHSTCPLCRSTVEAGVPEMTIPVENHESVPELGSSNSPIQRDGDVRETTTSFADRMKRVDVRIDVPNRNELALGRELTELRLNSPSQGFRSPGSRLLSLKRIMTMSRKSPAVSPSSGVGTSSVPVFTESDVESAMHESTQESSLR